MKRYAGSTPVGPEAKVKVTGVTGIWDCT